MVNLTRKIKLPILYVQPFCWGLYTSAFYPEQGVGGGSDTLFLQRASC